MGEVYSNSFCNLAATASSDGRGGLFRVRSPDSTIPYIVNATQDRLKKGKFLCLDLREWYNEVGSAPLNCRGWVLQERLLSPRTLHFGASQLYWECEELKEVWRLRKAVLPVDYHNALVFLVLQYSKCTLTQESDKLVAISGAARLMNERLDHLQYRTISATIPHSIIMLL